MGIIIPRCLSVLVLKYIAILSDSNQELIDAHGGIDCNLPPKVALEIVLLDGTRRLVSDKLGEAMNSHGEEQYVESQGVYVLRYV